jgi:hypothetical protein
MKKKKYLPLYKELCVTGGLSGDYGLCGELSDRGLHEEKTHLRDLFHPPFEIDMNITHLYWGSGDDQNRLTGVFTPMRQNILLLMAAMNGEL